MDPSQGEYSPSSTVKASSDRLEITTANSLCMLAHNTLQRQQSQLREKRKLPRLPTKRLTRRPTLKQQLKLPLRRSSEWLSLIGFYDDVVIDNEVIYLKI